MNDNEDLFQKLTHFIKECNDKQTDTLREEIKNQVNRVNEDLRQLRETVKEEKERLKRIEERQQELNEQAQRALKKNNIIIWDLDYEDTSNLSELVLSTINKFLGLALTLSHCNNIYPLGGGQNPRPVVIQFVSFLTKLQVLKESRNLKNIKGKRIGISEDLTRAERAVRKILVKHKKLAVSQGNKAHIKGNCLFVNGEKFTADALEDLPEGQEHQPVKSNSAPPTPTIQQRSKRQNSSESETENTIDIEKGEIKEQTDEVFKKVQNTIVENRKKPSLFPLPAQSSSSGYSLRQVNKDKEKAKLDKEKPKPRPASRSSAQSSPATGTNIKSSQK